MVVLATRLFPLWLILFSGVAFWFPRGFLPIAPYISPLLGLIMFGMGITLTREDFARILRDPTAIIVGVLAQYGIMPIAGLLVALALRLPPQQAIGVVLVGSCPGGTASNVITYLAKGDVALSVSVTSVTTLLAPVLTPLFTWLLAGRWVHVPFAEMLLSVAEVILLPVIAGLFVRTIWEKRLHGVVKFAPILSVAGIIAIVSCIVALNTYRITHVGPRVLLTVVLHNGLGLCLGYWVAAIFIREEAKRRAVAVEVGMQNSGLGVALAMRYFSASAALPSAVFSIWHNLSGSVLAAYWSSRRGRRITPEELPSGPLPGH